ncbi:MAG TPA: hypothetical protein VGS22_07870 [Thermoanaerobaculia bacterium]|nr:hypothetical protein [Thermoanaerobaculia bacterium]
MKRLLELVRSACYSWNGNKRDLESAVGIGHGRLEEILDGQPELRVRHLVSLARLLKVRPSDFLRLAYPGDESTAPSQLEDWVGGPKPPNARRKPQPLAPEHEERIRELIRDELAKREK